MCAGCVAVAGVVLATSQMVPIQAQPVVLSSEVTMATKALAAFPGNSAALTAGQRSVIKDFVYDNALGERVICSVSTLARDSVSTKARYKARAKVACDYAKRLNPFLKTSVTVKVTTNSSSAGRVSIQMKQTPVAVDLPVAEPPAAKSPFLTPFPTVFTRQELVSAALSSMKNFMETSNQAKPVKLIYQDTIPTAERGWISKLVQTTMATLPFTQGQEPVVVIASSDEFIISSLRQNDRATFDPTWWCGSPTTYERYCASAGWGAMNYKDSIEKSIPISDPGKRAVVAHELFHVWQKTVDGSPATNNRDPRSPQGLPLWFAEGNANFFGFAIAHHDGATDYSAGRASQVDQYMRANVALLSDHIFWDRSPYGIGQASAEYLVASVGVEKVLAVYKKVGAGLTFAAAFEESIGISLADYYLKFEAARANF